MTPHETLLLTRYVKACCPQQAIDEYTPDAWHDLLGDLSLADCRAAVVAGCPDAAVLCAIGDPYRGAPDPG